jgi:hypothetical protein
VLLKNQIKRISQLSGDAVRRELAKVPIRGSREGGLRFVSLGKM